MQTKTLLFLIGFSFAAVAVIYLIGTFNLRYQRKKKLAKYRKHENERIEKYVLKCSLEALCEHSNPQFIARIAIERLKELMEFGVSPVEVYKILEGWKLHQQYLQLKSFGHGIMRLALVSEFQRNFSDIDLISWRSKVDRIKKEDWVKMNDTVISSIKPSGFVWDPLKMN